MLDSKHYVPILKWKSAEQGALEVLENKHSSHITPLIELVMPKPKFLFKDKEKKIKKSRQELIQELITVFKTKRFEEIPEEIIKSCNTRMAFIDFSLLYTIDLKVESIKTILERAKEKGANLIPVLNLSDGEEIKKAIQQTSKKHNNGVCLRIVSSDLEDIEKLNMTIKVMLKNLEMDRKKIDLLVDIKEIKNDTDYGKYFRLSQNIENLNDWRSFIFAGGAFPEDLSECKVEESKSLPRVEWMSWLNIRKTKVSKRLPTFADYAVRNPIYNESLQFYQSTASIKYTLQEEWLILRGKKGKYEMYLAHAALLVKDGRFYGEKFSDGDKFISDKAKHLPVYMVNPKGKGTGNTEMWLKAFINHHLAATADQIANL